jgi:hypothetical protein
MNTSEKSPLRDGIIKLIKRIFFESTVQAISQYVGKKVKESVEKADKSISNKVSKKKNHHSSSDCCSSCKKCSCEKEKVEDESSDESIDS